jgi:hypothetical protein
MGELVLYDSDSTDEWITADLDAGYDVMFDKLKEQFESEEEAKARICRVIELSVLQTIQQTSDQPTLHPAIADLIASLQETEEIDLDSLTQTSVHQVYQGIE